MDLISYGSVTTDFKLIAQLNGLIKKANTGELKKTRLDCFRIEGVISHALNDAIEKKLAENKLEILEFELFKPTKNYPSHVDEGGTSYFIPLEEGTFVIGDVHYPIVPFVLYGFEDSMLHNTNFGAIMLK